MIRKALALLAIVTAAGVPAIYAATRPARLQATSTAAPTTSAQETIICPLTGEEISPCCCPLQKGKP